MEKKRLRRRCVQCLNIFDVWRVGDDDWWDEVTGNGKVYVSWAEDPYAAEINDDFTKMWLCDICSEQSALDI